jgi:cysteine desulfurase
LGTGVFGSGEGADGSGRAPGRVYLDDAGAAPVLPEVSQALARVPDGNPSSLHAEGRAARAALDAARDVLASALGAERTEVTFTASGTEAVNLAILGAARRLPRQSTILTWAAEHQSVIAAARHLQATGRAVTIGPTDHNATVDLDAIKPGIGLISIGLANNEVGTIQPVAEAIERAHDAGALVHVDACSGPRWIDIPKGADLVSLSGHKLGAGRGGALYVRDGVRLDPQLHGGPQEWGRRAGREDVAAAVAIATAMRICTQQREARSRTAATHSAQLRATLEELGGRLTGAENRLPNYATATFPARRGEDMLLALDLGGMAASSGSACASGSLDPSHVLLAMGLTMDEALGSLRLTTGYSTTDEEVSRARALLGAVLARTHTHA